MVQFENQSGRVAPALETNEASAVLRAVLLQQPLHKSKVAFTRYVMLDRTERTWEGME